MNKLKDVIEYLSNPIRKGVWHYQAKINLISIKELFVYLSDNCVGVPEIMDFYSEISDIKTCDQYLNALILTLSYLKNIESDKDDILKYLNEGDIINNSDDLSWSVKLNANKMIDEDLINKNVFGEGRFSSMFLSSEGNKVEYRFNDDVTNGAFESRIYYDKNMLLDIEILKEDKIMSPIFNILTLRKKDVDNFDSFLKSIPIISDTYEMIKHRKTYSTRYVFNLYPKILPLWFNDESIVNIPHDLKEYIKNSLSYYNKKEWRNSIILCAIAVETILADIYEEEKKDFAPDDTLGSLYKEVKKVFPKEIQNSIEIVNECRIASVHRSRYPVSDRESLNSLYGTTAITIWYSKNF